MIYFDEGQANIWVKYPFNHCPNFLKIPLKCKKKLNKKDTKILIFLGFCNIFIRKGTLAGDFLVGVATLSQPSRSWGSNPSPTNPNPDAMTNGVTICSIKHTGLQQIHSEKADIAFIGKLNRQWYFIEKEFMLNHKSKNRCFITSGSNCCLKN